MVRVLVGAGIALLLATVAVVVFERDRGFRAEAREAVGTVYANRVDREGARRVYRPIVRFMDGEGQTHSFDGDTTLSGRAAHEPGEKVHVLYLASDPGRARIDTMLGRWAVPVLCGLGALLSLAFFVRRGRPRVAAP